MAAGQVRLTPRGHRYVLYALATVTGLLGVWAGAELLAGGGAQSVAFQNAANLFVVAGIVTFIFRTYRPSAAPDADTAGGKEDQQGPMPLGPPFRRRLAAHRPSPSDPGVPNWLVAAASGADSLEEHLESQRDGPGRALRLEDIRTPDEVVQPEDDAEDFVTIHVERRPDPVTTVKDAAGRDVEIVEYDDARGAADPPERHPRSAEDGAENSAVRRSPHLPEKGPDQTWSPNTPYIQ